MYVKKERSIGKMGPFLDFSWVNACFSKLHLGRVIYSNNTASHGKGEGLKGVKRSLPQRAVGYPGRQGNHSSAANRKGRCIVGDVLPTLCGI